MDEEALGRLAGELTSRDAYGENAHLARGLVAMGSEHHDSVRAHVAHQLWCAWRQARHADGSSEPLEVVVATPEHIAATADRPTMLLAPMTLAPVDAAAVIGRLARHRPLIVYGEDIGVPGSEWAHLPVAGEGLAALQRILSTLRAGGVLVTYADFVYAGHRGEPVTLFGCPRTISSAFVSLALRPGTTVLPLVCRRSRHTVIVETRPPFRLGDEPSGSRSDAPAMLARASSR